MSNRDLVLGVAQVIAKQGVRLAGHFATRAAEAALDALAALAPEPEETPIPGPSPWDEDAWKPSPMQKNQPEPSVELRAVPASEDPPPTTHKAAPKKAPSAAPPKSQAPPKEATRAGAWQETEDQALVDLWAQEKSHAEIADVLERPLGSVKSRIRALRKKGLLSVRKPGRRPKSSKKKAKKSAKKKV